MSKTVHLTKSLFKLSLECLTKIYYKINKDFEDNNTEDTFLESLAEGGFQVGELAKYRFPGGIDLSENNAEYGLEKTKELMDKKEDMIIFEAAFKYKNLYIKCDVLEIKDNTLYLYEVKSKSYGGEEFLSKRDGRIKKEWESYIYDVYFQEFVLTKLFPSFKVVPHLTMPDKTKVTSVNKLNQKFFLRKEIREVKHSETQLNPKTFVKYSIEIDDNIDIGDDIMSDVNVLDLKDIVYKTKIHNMTFEDYINYISNLVLTNTKHKSDICKDCFTCEFNNNKGEQNGFRTCIKDKLKVKDDFFDKPNICDIWNFRPKDKLLSENILLFEDLSKDDIMGNKYTKSKIETKQRQWLQVEKFLNNDSSVHVDKVKLKKHMDSWTYPLHFIDFETTAMAIPFSANMRPYEGVAFQFSHHIVYEDGEVEHFGQYLNTHVGKFPNYDFIRELKVQLSNDDGSIFMYSKHENSFLCTIYQQLLESNESDTDELLEFIESIASPSNSIPKLFRWDVPKRYMVDMLDIVKECYYQKDMGGSNSIKYLLPAILNNSEFLKEKYSKPTYNGYNFKNKQWIEYTDEGNVINPYKSLEKLFTDDELESDMELITNETLADGGAAMQAYAKMQFLRMSDEERYAIENGLRRYVELDTLSMVMLYEHFKELIDE